MEITPTQEKEIRVFETVLANTEKIIPFDRFYVVLYDRRNASLYYPVVRLEDKSCLKLPDLAEGPWAPRPFAPDNQWPDCLWRSDVDVPNGSNPQSWLAERKPWQKDEKDEQRIGLDYHLAPYPRSWLIAPLKARGGAVMGVLVAEDLHREGAYGDDLQTWFATAANRVAGTLSSLRLVESLRTVNRVGQRLTARARQSVAEILELIHIEVGKLMDTRDMYVALYDAPTCTVRFPLFYMNGKPIKWESREVNLADAAKRKLTEEVLFSGETENVPNFTQWFQDRGREVPAKPSKSWLGVPLKTGNRTLGVIALQNDEVEELYSVDDQEILEAMASQVSAALANAQLVERLQAVNAVGQQLTSGTQLGEGEILQLIYEQAGKLMDTRDMFVAFYDAKKQELSFPLFYVDGEPIEWESRPVNLEDPLQRKLTEEVLYHRKLLNVPNFTQWFEEQGRPVPEKPPKSWLGVPLMIEDRVLGVIALQNDEIEDLYGPDDEAVLQAMASQVAATLENAQLLADLRKRNEELQLAQATIAESESILVRTSMAADFVHHMNNLAGTIPVWVDQANGRLAQISVDDLKLSYYLGNIKSDAGRLLRAAEELKEPVQPEPIDVNSIFSALVRQAYLHAPANIEFDLLCPDTPLIIYGVDADVRNAFWNLMKNGIEAMPYGGKLSISVSNYKGDNEEERVRIDVVDTGIGFTDASRAFQPFYTTKAGHMGYGLWRTRNIFGKMGGSVDLSTKQGSGTTVTITLLIYKEEDT